MREGDGVDFFQGCLFAIPRAIAFWALVIGVVWLIFYLIK